MTSDFSPNCPKYLKQFAIFAMESLDILRLRGNVEIEYVQGSLEDESYGCCVGDNRETTIYIASQSNGESVSREQKLKTLAHELVHAKQYLTRELISSESDEYAGRWKGKMVRENEYSHFLLPWEVEAEAAEQPIYDLWKSSL